MSACMEQETHPVQEQRSAPSRPGCAQAVAIAALTVWLLLGILGAALLGSLVPAGRAAVTLALVALLLLPPFLAAALLTRRRHGWEAISAVAAVLTAITGYVLLDALVRAVLPAEPRSVLHTRETWAAALRLALLFPYTLLATVFTPRLAGASRRSLTEWLGLDRFDGSTLLLALASGALLTLPWPLTGALGDRLTSLALAFQALAWALPSLVLFWGLAQTLLHDRLARPWEAALLTALLYILSATGDILPTGEWGAAANGLLLLPLALLLAELRARPGGIYPLLPVAFLLRAAPLLFVDPRDVLAQGGIPELQHLISHAVVLALTALLALALWVERGLLTLLRGRLRLPTWSRVVTAALAALALWGIWVGLYVFAGEPGLADDGFLIILEEQADLSSIPIAGDRQTRLAAVRDALIATAETTQAPLRAELERLGVPYRSYYIINMIRVDGHRWLMGHFARQPGVAEVLLNPNVRRYPRRLTLPQYGEESEFLPAVQDNLAAIHADRAWALGVTGEGIIVAGQDTGYDWTHPALLPHYRGRDSQHDFNWHDAWDHAAVPFDEDGHGTHTMGTILGDDGAGNRTGVAPGAEWIGCRNMRRGFGNPGAYAECMEFFLAPYPHGGDPFRDGDVSRAPHLVNNSWGCPDIEGCAPDTLQRAVEALRAAGIMVVVSVGNEGPGCATITDPPANYDAAFSVGATDNSGQILGFSSRGPVGGRIKPDVSAPGSNVRSSLPGGEYGLASGTSMAGPHVAGLVALLWSAQPTLIGDIDGTEWLICQTAVPRPVEETCTTADTTPTGPFAALFANPICACGDVTGTPNNVYGCGFIDAGAAVEAAQ